VGHSQEAAAAGRERVAALRGCWCRTPHGKHPRAVACSGAGRPRYDWHQGSDRCRAVRRAGHLLLHRPAIVVGACSRWNYDAASQRDEKHYEEEDNRFSRAGRFIKLNGCGSCPRAGSCAMNEACESSRAQENVKTVPGFVSSLVPLSASSPLRSAWSKTPPAPRRARAAGRRAASPNGPRLRAASSL